MDVLYYFINPCHVMQSLPLHTMKQEKVKKGEKKYGNVMHYTFVQVIIVKINKS